MATFYIVDWGAWATLTTGVLAVGAALKIGLKQTAVAERQVEIMDRQSRLELARHNADLFDRRYEVYDAVKGFLVQIILSGDRPDREIELRFHNAVTLSGLLFKPEVRANLTEIDQQSSKLFFLTKRSARRHANGEPPNVADADRSEELFDDLAYKMTHLPELFGSELKLGDA